MQMTARERTLAFIVGALVTGVLSYVLLQFFLKNRLTLNRQFAEKSVMVTGMRTLIAERELWQERDRWIQQNQPKLDNATGAGVDLVEQIKRIGGEHALTPTEANINPDTVSNSRSGPLPYQPVSVSFNVKGKWEDIVGFLYDVQSPTNFLVFEKAALQVDKEDKTLVSGSFKVAKWYAPNL